MKSIVQRVPVGLSFKIMLPSSSGTPWHTGFFSQPSGFNAYPVIELGEV